MSMNLNASFNNKVEHLRQTPSQISYMCIVQPDGSIPYELTGKKAKHALQIYLQWVKYSTNGQWSSFEDLENAKKDSLNECDRIKSLIEKSKNIRVWVM